MKSLAIFIASLIFSAPCSADIIQGKTISFESPPTSSSAVMRPGSIEAYEVLWNESAGESNLTIIFPMTEPPESDDFDTWAKTVIEDRMRNLEARKRSDSSYSGIRTENFGEAQGYGFHFELNEEEDWDCWYDWLLKIGEREFFVIYRGSETRIPEVRALLHGIRQQRANK